MDESFHDGAVVGLAADGTIAFTVGDPSVIVYPRSSNKPLQAVAMVHAGGRKLPILQNCSGKHAGMLVTSAHNFWKVDPSYLEFDHPLQVRIGETIAELAGEAPAHVGVDGCGAPAHAFSLLGLARA